MTCFHCGITLHKWLPGDDLWYDHVRWSPSCHFARLVKGEKYVRHVVGNLIHNEAQHTSAAELGVTLVNSAGTSAEIETLVGAGELAGVERSTEDEDIAYKCKICLDRGLEVVTLPCGHWTTCTQCAPALTHCSICRSIVKGFVRAYI